VSQTAIVAVGLIQGAGARLSFRAAQFGKPGDAGNRSGVRKVQVFTICRENIGLERRQSSVVKRIADEQTRRSIMRRSRCTVTPVKPRISNCRPFRTS